MLLDIIIAISIFLSGALTGIVLLIALCGEIADRDKNSTRPPGQKALGSSLLPQRKERDAP